LAATKLRGVGLDDRPPGRTTYTLLPGPQKFVSADGPYDFPFSIDATGIISDITASAGFGEGTNKHAVRRPLAYRASNTPHGPPLTRCWWWLCALSEWRRLRIPWRNKGPLFTRTDLPISLAEARTLETLVRRAQSGHG